MVVASGSDTACAALFVKLAVYTAKVEQVTTSLEYA